MSGYSARRMLDYRPENSIEVVRQAILAATQTQLIGRDYKHAIDRPGGQEWEGKAARAAQDTAAADEKVVYRATQHVLDEGPKALDTLAFQVTEHHKRAVGYYTEATTHGYKVSEDLVVEWIVPSRTTPELIAEGKRCATKFQKMIRGEHDKWWAAELEAQAQIDAISNELDTSYNPIGGLSANAGHLDGAYLQGGTQWDSDVLKRVQAASSLSDPDLKTLAEGGKVDIGSNRMQYLYQFAHSFDGKTPAEIAAIKAGLPPAQREAMTRAFALVANDHVKSGVDNASGVTEATKGNFIPASGSLRDLASGMETELTRQDRTGVTQGRVSGTPYTEMHGVGAMQDMAKIFDGAGGYLNGSEAGRAMLDAATQYSNADIDHRANPTGGGLQTDAHGAPGGVLADQETPLRNALADIYQSAGQDHVGVHEAVTAEPTDGEKYLRGILQENWGDQSGKVDDTLAWAGDHSQMGAEVANAQGHYMADHKPELQNMAGGGNFAQNNPEMAGTSAQVQGEYLSQYADSDPAHRQDPAIAPFKNVGEMRDMVSTFDQGHYAGEIINEQAQGQHQQLLNDAARTGSDADLKAAGRLSQGMLDGALDSVGAKPADQNIEDLKKLIGKVPFAGDAMDVLDSAQKHMENATKLPDGFAQNLAQSGSFGNITAYQTSVLDALAQAHPGIADDPLVGKYINGGHFDPSTISEEPKSVKQAQTDLDNWFKTTAPRDYNVNLDHWQTQEQMGRNHSNWEWIPGK